MIRAKLVFVLVALGAMSGLGLCLSGCKRSEEKPSQSAPSPEVYMKNAQFRKAVHEKALALRAIEKERAPLIARMKELFKQHGENLSKLQQVPEWKELHSKILALNARYEEMKKSQLKLVGDTIAPKGSGKVGSSSSGRETASPFGSGKVGSSSSGRGITRGEAELAKQVARGVTASPFGSGKVGSSSSGRETACPLNKEISK